MYDLAIIGGGPGAYVAAQRAGAAGLETVLFEKNALGGVCLNEGCIPTKTLLYSAKIYNSALQGAHYGVSASEIGFDYEKIVGRKNKVVRKLTAGIKASLKAHNVTVVPEEAFIEGRNNEGIIVNSASGQYVAKNLLICTGSQAVIPPIVGLKEAGETVVTNREILSLESLPKELVIIGGGVIGMEFAALYNALGSKVTVIEMLPKILGPMDGEISALLQKIYTKRGIDFKLNSKVTGIEGNCVVFNNPEGQEERVSGEKILISVGRRANLQGFGLENLGVETDRGIKVDQYMRTSVANVYAAGDVTGFSMLAHTASREGEVAVNHILGKDDKMSYLAVPSVVYTNPEVASVGLSEEQYLKEAETRLETNPDGQSAADAQQTQSDGSQEIGVLKLPMAYSGRFVAENEGGEGLCKIVFDKSNHKILGVHMLGNPCSEIIQSACIAIESGMSVENLQKIIFPHPSVSEILKEVAYTLPFGTVLAN